VLSVNVVLETNWPEIDASPMTSAVAKTGEETAANPSAAATDSLKFLEFI
tara:strand:- start:341 stop:490 length:150 start_codon:yes stop_codon:yes gene_type:complete